MYIVRMFDSFIVKPPKFSYNRFISNKVYAFYVNFKKVCLNSFLFFDSQMVLLSRGDMNVAMLSGGYKQKKKHCIVCSTRKRLNKN